MTLVPIKKLLKDPHMRMYLPSYTDDDGNDTEFNIDILSKWLADNDIKGKLSNSGGYYRLRRTLHSCMYDNMYCNAIFNGTDYTKMEGYADHINFWRTNDGKVVMTMNPYSPYLSKEEDRKKLNDRYPELDIEMYDKEESWYGLGTIFVVVRPTHSKIDIPLKMAW